MSVECGSGPVDLELPNTGEDYEVDVDVGSGPFEVTVFSGADVSMEVDGGSGPFNLDIGEVADLVVVNTLIPLGEPVAHKAEEVSREVDLAAVREVPAVRELHPEDGIPGLE